jgi:hypothetical protein
MQGKQNEKSTNMVKTKTKSNVNCSMYVCVEIKQRVTWVELHGVLGAWISLKKLSLLRD